MAPTRPPQSKSKHGANNSSISSLGEAELSTRQLSTKMIETPHRSPIRKRRGITAAQKQALMDNLQLEITERARRLRAQYALQAQQLRSRIEMRLNRVPIALRKAKLGDLMDKWTAQKEREKEPKQLPSTPHPTRPALKSALSSRSQATAPPHLSVPTRAHKRLSDEISDDKENSAEPTGLPHKRQRADAAGESQAHNGHHHHHLNHRVQILSPTSDNLRIPCAVTPGKYHHAPLPFAKHHHTPTCFEEPHTCPDMTPPENQQQNNHHSTVACLQSPTKSHHHHHHHHHHHALSPAKSTMGPPASPTRSARGLVHKASSNLLASMVEKAKTTRSAVSARKATTSSTASTATATASRNTRKPPVPTTASTRGRRKNSATSESSDGSTATTGTVVRKTAAASRATVPGKSTASANAKRTVMSTIKSATTRKAPAAKATAASTAKTKGTATTTTTTTSTRSRTLRKRP